MDRSRLMDDAEAEPQGGLVRLVVLSLLVGGITGLVAGAFRLVLERAEHWRGEYLEATSDWGVLGFLLAVGIASAMTALAAWLVHRIAPRAAGSGIPDVELVLHGTLPPQEMQHPPVKFLGGLLAIGAGQALGREGPSVEMGAVLAGLVGRWCGCTWADLRALMAAGAGAGLATAFNAPIAGAVFVIEEMVRRFETRTTIATLGASTGAITVARCMVGPAPDFSVESFTVNEFTAMPLYLILGGILGLLGVMYHHAILSMQRLPELLRGRPPELWAAIVGAIVGGLAWYAPSLVGGGESLTQRLLVNDYPWELLPAMLLIRFLLGPLSYSAKTPGGLFAPLLVLGAGVGLGMGSLARDWFPSLIAHPEPFAIVGMAAFFTAVVRAPTTGIILVVEMTASDTLLLPMLGASLIAMAVPTALGTPPVYDALRERALPAEATEASRGSR